MRWERPARALMINRDMFFALNVFLKTKISRIGENSLMRECTQAPVPVSRTWEIALLQKIQKISQFWREFYKWMRHVGRFVFSPFIICFLWSDTMIPRWWESYFWSLLSRENPNCLWYRLKSWHCRDFLKNHASNHDLACDSLKTFSLSGMIMLLTKHGSTKLALIFFPNCAKSCTITYKCCACTEENTGKLECQGEWEKTADFCVC